MTDIEKIEKADEAAENAKGARSRRATKWLEGEPGGTMLTFVPVWSWVELSLRSAVLSYALPIGFALALSVVVAVECLKGIKRPNKETVTRSQLIQMIIVTFLRPALLFLLLWLVRLVA